MLARPWSSVALTEAKRPSEQGGSLVSVLAVGRRPKILPRGARHKYSRIF